MADKITEKAGNLKIDDKTLFVCEISGDDENNNGLSADSPLRTAVKALENGATHILIRKSLDESDDGSKFNPISGAALKKSRKAVDINKKKAAKEKEKKMKEAEAAASKAEQDRKNIEAAKSIVLKRPAEPSQSVNYML